MMSMFLAAFMCQVNLSYSYDECTTFPVFLIIIIIIIIIIIYMYIFYTLYT